MRLLYLFPEEWTGRRAREVHTLSTCVALAQCGAEVTLVTAGGIRDLERQLEDVAGQSEQPGLRLVGLSRAVGPVKSASIFDFHLRNWLGGQPRFDAGYVIHLKAGAMAMRAAIPYLFEAHEVFAETPQKDETEQKQLHDLEKRTLSAATWRVATSKALAAALVERYGKPGDYSIVPNAGDPPLPHSVAAPEGPLIYAGSIADWKGLDVVIEATRAAEMRLKIIGGSELEWNQLSAGRRTEHVIWRARMPLKELPNALEGARAGLIPTRTETPSGRYSCPMKLFDYARCGLPVLSTALPSLQTLEAGSWCRQVEPSTLEAWTEAMRYFRFNPVQGETARAWAGVHTWRRRAEALMRIFFARRRAD